MGDYLRVLPGPLDGDWPGVEKLVPSLPSQVEWSVRSGATLRALESAALAVGAVALSIRSAASPIASVYAGLSLEARASVALTRWAVPRRVLREQFLSAGDSSIGGRINGSAGGLLFELVGLGLWGGRVGEDESTWRWLHRLEGTGSAWSDAGGIPARTRWAFASDLAGLVRGNGEPALVRAALAMMAVAAGEPASQGTAIAARRIAIEVLETSLGPTFEWCGPPVSWGFLGHDDSWQKVATVLACEGEPDPVALDEALREVFEAFERAATAMLPLVCGVSERAHRAKYSGASRDDLTGTQRDLIDTLTALPALNVEQASALVGLRQQTVRRALRQLVAAGVLLEGKTPAGESYFESPQYLEVPLRILWRADRSDEPDSGQG